MTLIDKKQVAQMFNITERSVNNWVDKKIITPAIRVNNRPKFSKEELEKMISTGGNVCGK